jgi:hypothetical protein
MSLKKAAAKAQMIDSPQKHYDYPITPPRLLRGVAPSSAPVMAMDAPAYTEFQYSGGGFPGFPYLAQLATRSEFRAFAAALSTELTREWIELTSSQDDDSASEKLKAIDAEFKRLNLRGVIQKAAEHDCLFGRGQIYLDIVGADPKTPLILSPKTIGTGAINAIKTIEAIWTTPAAYNSNDPTASDFYAPTGWYVLGKEVHASRLMTIVTRPLPDILKPAFNFAGMSLSQLAEPYVDNWLRTRQSVSDLISNFSITALATAMDQVLQGDDDGQDLINRATLFTTLRSNKGLMLLDKEREELVQINTPLSGLHELQSQAQEQMCSVSRLPAIILTGISPSGLNASSESEVRAFYDWIAAQQESHWRKPIETVLSLVQLSLFGEIDPDISFNFAPLYQMSAAELAGIRAQDANTAATYIDRGVLDPQEERERLARSKDSGYHGLDVDAMPEIADAEEA